MTEAASPEVEPVEPSAGEQDGQDPNRNEPRELTDFMDEATMHKIIEEWDRYDSDQNGSITEEEFRIGERAWHKRVYGEVISESELEEHLEFFKRIGDANNDDEVSWMEFVESKALMMLDAQNRLAECLTEEEIESAKVVFDRIDADGSGGICESEAHAYFEQKYARDVGNGLRTWQSAALCVETSVKRLMNTHCTGGGDLITFEEFVAEEAKTIIMDRSKGQQMKAEQEASGGAEPAEHLDEVAQVLSESQLRHAELKFKDLDMDDSRQIEFTELKRIFKSLGLNMTKSVFMKKLKAGFKRADKDNSKGLDFEEFKHMYNYLYLADMDLSVFDTDTTEV